MARRNRVKVGNTSIEISDLMDRVVEQVRDGAAGEILLEMEKSQEELKVEAQKAWPVGRERKALPGEPSGPTVAGSDIGRPRVHSVNLFEQATALSASGVEVTLRNTADWAWSVKFGRRAKAGQTQGRRAFNELVRKPGTKTGRALADSMEERILELAERAKEGKK